MPQSSSYSKITVYRSHTAGAVPALANMSEGEIAINTADGKIYTRNDNDEIVDLSGGNNHTHEAVDITDIESYVDSRVLIANRPTVEDVSATSYTLDDDDETKLLRFTAATAVTVTVPPNSSEALPVGFICHVHQAGAGVVTVAAGSGVTVNSSVSLSTNNQYSALSLFKVGTDSWVLVGDQQ